MKILENIISGILAGIAISFGCVVFLKVGGVAGAALFAFGLLTVLLFKLRLFTGIVGYFDFKRPVLCTKVTVLTLLANILGAYLTALAIKVSAPDLIESAQGIVAQRLAYSGLQSFLLAVGCGFIMTVCVWAHSMMGKTVVVLFGIPVFILSGYLHCIADAFYYSLAGELPAWNYALSVLGNFVGCNILRLKPFSDDSLFFLEGLRKNSDNIFHI